MNLNIENTRGSLRSASNSDDESRFRITVTIYVIIYFPQVMYLTTTLRRRLEDKCQEGQTTSASSELKMNN